MWWSSYDIRIGLYWIVFCIVNDTQFKIDTKSSQHSLHLPRLSHSISSWFQVDFNKLSIKFWKKEEIIFKKNAWQHHQFINRQWSTHWRVYSISIRCVCARSCLFCLFVCVAQKNSHKNHFWCDQIVMQMAYWLTLQHIHTSRGDDAILEHMFIIRPVLNVYIRSFLHPTQNKSPVWQSALAIMLFIVALTRPVFVQGYANNCIWYGKSELMTIYCVRDLPSRGLKIVQPKKESIAVFDS